MCHTSESSVCHTREICVVCWFVLGFVSKVVFPSCAPSTSFSWDLFSRCLFASSTGLCWDFFLRCVFSFVCAVYWFVLGFVFEVCFFFRVRRLLVCAAVVDEVVEPMLIESILCLLKTCNNNNNNNENNVPGVCRV